LAAVSSDPNAPSGSARRLTLLIMGAGTVFFAVHGWKLFYFLTDDAHIAFRYVSNSLAGRGLVWNAAPFRPVEGYTSFLWVILLREVWAVTGIEPPSSSGVLSLFFALGTLYLTFRFILTMSLPQRMERWRLVFLAFAITGILVNRTFLAWMSSGLETALFNFMLTWWVYEGTRQGVPTAWRLTRLSSAAALCALSRPDGLLVVAATSFQIAVSWYRSGRNPRFLVTALPLLAIPTHLLWRFHTYGYWLPNTFRAKVHKPWPESGIRYFTSFVVEYSVWIWVLLVVGWAVRQTVATRRSPASAPPGPRLITLTTIAMLVAHWAYYTFIVGGDNFEFRAYSHLIPLLFVSAVWVAARLLSTPVLAAEALAAFVVFSCPIPWLHWFCTRDLTNHNDTRTLYVPLARLFSSPFRPLVRVWDDTQDWLIHHAVGIRHQEHKIFFEWVAETFGTREDGLRFGLDHRTVFAVPWAGVPGWTLPNTAILDVLGLNDPVVPTIGVLYEDNRKMAHDRFAPNEYIACFRPNTAIVDGRPTLLRNDVPLTDDEVRECETRDWSHIVKPGHFVAWWALHQREVWRTSHPATKGRPYALEHPAIKIE
jgi:arabinofuranosyltransferase